MVSFLRNSAWWPAMVLSRYLGSVRPRLYSAGFLTAWFLFCAIAYDGRLLSRLSRYLGSAFERLFFPTRSLFGWFSDIMVSFLHNRRMAGYYLGSLVVLSKGYSVGP